MLPAALSLEPPVPGIDLTIAPNDTMFVRVDGDEIGLAMYLESGRTALQAMRAALTAAGTPEVRRILDLPCGYGRVLRVLRAAYPDADITACDIEHEGVDFCAEQFGAEPVYSRHDPARIALEGQYDLIWCGSLFTHLDAGRWPGFLRTFRKHLSPEGVCVFTTHGIGAEEYIHSGRNTYGLAEQQAQRLVRRYQRYGFAFQPYQTGGDYGISLSSPMWVMDQIRKLPQTRMTLVLEKGFHNHQDVLAFGVLPEPEWVRVGM